jgi:integrase
MAQTIALEGIISCSIFHFHEDTFIFRFHELRHTFATLSLQNGVDVKTLSNTLGHYSAGFTLDTYTHATQRMKREAADTIGSVIDQAM